MLEVQLYETLFYFYGSENLRYGPLVEDTVKSGRCYWGFRGTYCLILKNISESDLGVWEGRFAPTNFLIRLTGLLEFPSMLTLPVFL